MNTTSLATALSVLRDTVSNHPRSIDGALRRDIGTLCTELFTALTSTLDQIDDPRSVLHTLELIEEHYRAVLRAQLQATAAAEATGAHTLAPAEYNQLRQGTTHWHHPPELLPGRAHHKDTAALLAAWTGIDEFEAATRVQDTHRLIARRTMAGTPAGPRFQGLSALFLDPARDPRPARNAARRIEKFEPADQIHNGTPLPPAAAGPDGVLLEDHVVRVLSGHDPATARKRVNALCTAYKEANTNAIAPREYLRRVRTVMGVDIYQLAVAGANAEVLRSLIAQLDNPATQAGQAARTTTTPDDTTNPEDDAGTEGVAGRCAEPGPEQLQEQEPVADWLKPTGPPPDWAIDPTTDPNPSRVAGAAHGPVPEPGPGAGPAPRADTPHREPTGPQPEPAPRDPHVSEVPAPEGPGTRGTPGPVQAMTEPPLPLPLPASTATAVQEGSAERLPVEERRLNGFMKVLKQRLTGTGQRTQVIPTINVYMHLAQLLELATAHGLTTHGVKLGASELRQMLCDAKVIPYVLGGQGQILDVGRARRTFTGAMRRALLARDRGCILPGCSYPPEYCEGDHWPEGGWAGGCGTSVAEGAMLCPREHDDRHAGKFRIVLHNGLPHVLFPEYLDPTQTPQRNTYWFSDQENITTPPPGADRAAATDDEDPDPP